MQTMNLLLIGFSSFMIALSGALVPGPLFTITVAESAKRGFMAGPLIIIGHGILELLIVGLLVFEVTPFLNDDAARLMISIVGGIVLIFMGYSLIKSARTARFNTSTKVKQKGMHPIFSGIIGSISNPYWYIWWITIGLGYLISSLEFGMLGIIVFFIGHIMADFGWYSLVSFSIVKGKRLLGYKGYRFLQYACGIFLLFFGAWFLKGI